MKTIYDIGDKVTLIAIVKGIQMHVDDKCPLYTLRVPDTSGYPNDVYVSETELEKMDSSHRPILYREEQEHE